jgi:hypothetical protein
MSLGAVFALVAPVFGQSSSSTGPSFEVGFALGVARPAVVIEEPCGVRCRPIATETGDSHRMVVNDIVGRVEWNRRTSTVVSVGWFGEATREYDYERLSAFPPFTAYRSHETTSFQAGPAIAFSQTFDLPLSSVAALFFGAGLEFRSVLRSERTISLNYSDSRPASDTLTEREGHQRSVFFSGGVRFSIARHAFAFAEGLVYVHTAENEFSDLSRALATPSVFGDIPWRWRAGAGVRF